MVEPDVPSLKEQAARYRKLAREILDERAHRALLELAAEYDARAAEKEGNKIVEAE
jgi:hypothetical protein